MLVDTTAGIRTPRSSLVFSSAPVVNQTLQRSYYQAPASRFVAREDAAILGELVHAHGFDTNVMQRSAWEHQIRTLRPLLTKRSSAHVFFEFAIPRMGKRVDVVLVFGGLIFVVEYKVGSRQFDQHAVEQALDYAVDLKNFHEGSHSRKIIPVLVATKAASRPSNDTWFEDDIAHIQLTNDEGLSNTIDYFVGRYGCAEFIAEGWANSSYKPTPTICEAAQALYAGHRVEEITRFDAGDSNLSRTADSIAKIIEHSKETGRKSICFVTGVPGSGKTLAGLNIANQRLNSHEDEHAVFLSGNGPLVKVLREALARHEVTRARSKSPPQRITKREALTRAATFIQNIHHFRDEYLRTDAPPVEQVVVFDEAQRAWNEQQTSSFMHQRKGIDDFSMSEPSFLLSVMDRRTDWCTVICIIGGGQEINTGEAGIGEWFDALRSSFPHWDAYVSEELTGSDHFGSENLWEHMKGVGVTHDKGLHLAVPVRSFRSEKVSAFIHAVIEGDQSSARSIMSELNDYPIVLTRDIEDARRWLKQKARGSERFGLVASSNAQRLRVIGPDVRVKIDPIYWFLNDREDVRSSYSLEDVATEFDIQGLELDWVAVCWDANFRRNNNRWSLHQFKGTKWTNVKDEFKRIYLVNSYRVLLTRARQGMVICVPEGDETDPTRKPDFYDPIFDYLKSCGIQVI